LLERAEESTILISSHDLGEVESFASHVGYLEQGQLRFSEELNVLTSHFREVELTFDTPPSLPAKVPPAWRQMNSSAAVIQFIDSQFDQQKTDEQIRDLFGEVRNATFTPMSLRSIFLTMARKGREER